MNTPIIQVPQKKREMSIILATAIFLALSINFFTTYFSITHVNYYFVLSLIFFFVGILILIRFVIFGNTSRIVRLNGAIFYNVNNNNIEPIKIIGYRFNNDFCEYLRAFLQENNAYWNLFSKKESCTIPINQFNPDDLNHYTIVNSVIEYAVLNKLQLHLNAYFVKNEIDRNNIVVLTRDQLDRRGPFF